MNRGIQFLIKLIEKEETRCCGLTTLAKLVEICFSLILSKCDEKILLELKETLLRIKKEEEVKKSYLFSFDIFYIQNHLKF